MLFSTRNYLWIYTARCTLVDFYSSDPKVATGTLNLYMKKVPNLSSKVGPHLCCDLHKEVAKTGTDLL